MISSYSEHASASSKKKFFAEDEVELATRTPLPQSSATVQVVEEDDSDRFNLARSSTHFSAASGVSQLPPVDRGFGAWSFLAAAFVVETVVWGFPTAYGTLLDAYLDDPEYSSQRNATSLLALIGPIVSGIMHCASPAINPLLCRYPRCARPLVWSGTVLCAISILASSWATTVNQLLALQGVIYSIGGSIIYAPTIFYMSQWFIERRGIANGVMFAGTSVGGIAIPLAFPPLLARFGIPNTLRIFAGATFLFLAPFLPFVRGRLPEAHTAVRGPAPRHRREWWKEPSFMLLLTTNILQAFGYFVPLLWLPTFASDLHLSASKSNLTLALLNATSVIGRLAVGLLSDRFDPWGLGLGMLILSAIVSFVLWGVLSYTFAGLIIFSAAFGIVSAGWATLWTGFIKPVANDPNLSTTLFGWLLATRGIGNILSTPVSTALRIARESNGTTSALHLGFDVADGRYEKVIIYTGTCFVGAAVVVIMGWVMEVRQRVRAAGMES
ncbi:MFS general substrate transporter [Schizophyllum commune Tattone D]|nr:MFS general substrate transporter [Schizophyllum commune Tattone D]